MAAALDPAQARQRRAYGYAWLTVCCWATVSTAFKLALAELHYAQLLEQTSRANEAVTYWKQYLQHDSRGPWSDHARNRIAEAEPASDPLA